LALFFGALCQEACNAATGGTGRVTDEIPAEGFVRLLPGRGAAVDFLIASFMRQNYLSAMPVPELCAITTLKKEIEVD
jgi:hypothetical protein